MVLSGGVDSDKTRAKVREGVLEPILPRFEKARRRRIKID